ncbi:MAG: hypothetical protein WCV85_00705 [Patescibacteria group bacterium]|jgi:hypothetical protein
MPQHWTTDISKRAFSIAFQAAEKVWKQTGDFEAYNESFEREYQEALSMLAGGGR